MDSIILVDSEFWILPNTALFLVIFVSNCQIFWLCQFRLIDMIMYIGYWVICPSSMSWHWLSQFVFWLRDLVQNNCWCTFVQIVNLVNHNFFLILFICSPNCWFDRKFLIPKAKYYTIHKFLISLEFDPPLIRWYAFSLQHAFCR